MPELLSRLLAVAAAADRDRVAIEEREQSLSFGELAVLAGRIATQLRQGGLKPGQRVGILMSKSIHAVASLYGVLYAGGGYVPLDASAPDSRLRYIVDDCQMSALIVDAKQFHRLAKLDSPKSLRHLLVIGCDASSDDVKAWQEKDISTTDWPTICDNEVLLEPVAVDDQALAYILYTSGSTGRPKGVMISHRNALAFVRWAQREIQGQPVDRFSSHAPFHFDLSVFDLYVACLSRATLVIAPDSILYFPAALANWIAQQRISVWYSVPSALVQMMQRGGAGEITFESLRAIIFAGEVMATKHLREWMAHVPGAGFYNFYGPTETNVCTSFRVPSLPLGDEPIPIGAAASGDRVLLVDDQDELIESAAEVGEICVDGPTVALGYWGDEAMTKARFAAMPNLTGHARPVYRTGDLAQWTEQGQLHFRGRRDHMVKSRGYRIELGEIESAILSHPSVREACVVAIPDSEIGNRLLACVGVEAGNTVDRETLCGHLLNLIPRYMMPEEFHITDSLPKTSTGKIDRQQLANAVEPP